VARRVVSVELLAKVFRYRKDLAAADQTTEQLTDSVEDLGKKSTTEFAKFGRGAKHAGSSADGLTHDLHQLERQISDTERELRQLNLQFALTGDAGTKRLIKGSERDLAFLKKVRTALTGDDEPSGGGFFSRVFAKLKELPSQLKGAAIVAVVGAGAALAPFLAAAISGAVLGAVGAGGIVGGIALAAQDEGVRKAAQGLGETFMTELSKGAAVFTEPVKDALAKLQPVVLTIAASLGRNFRTLAPLVAPVAEGLAGMATNVLPGLERATDKARVPIRALAHELPEIGDAVSDALDSISRESDSATEGVVGLSDAIELAIRETGNWLSYLGYLYGELVQVSNAVHDFTEESGFFGDVVASILGPAFVKWGNEADGQVDALNRAKDASKDYSGALGDQIVKTNAAADAAKQLADAIDDLFSKQMNIDQATIAYKKGLRDLNEELKSGARTLSLNSEEGLKNRSAVLNQIEAIEHLRDANVANGMSLDTANAKYAQQLEGLRKTLLALGYDKTAVDALINSYKGIPAKASTSVEAPGLATAESRLKRVEDLLDRLDGRTVKASILLEQEYRREENRQYRRWGGITQHAATGLLKDAGIYSAASPARYAFAEPQTGGEAFVPRNGDYGRSMAILSQAAAWYGASVQPGGSSGPASFDVHVYLDGTEITNRVDVRISERNRQTNRRVAARR